MKKSVEQIANTQLEIVTIQETRWTGNGLIKINNYSFQYSVYNKMGWAGTGFVVMKKECKYILGFEPYRKQICKGKYNNIKLIHVYPLIEDKKN